MDPTVRCEALLSLLHEACRQYVVERGAPPPTDPDGGTRALVRLLTVPSGAGGSGVPFFSASWKDLDEEDPQQLIDSWGKGLRYESVRSGGRWFLVLSSAGPDGVFGTPDDLSAR